MIGSPDGHGYVPAKSAAVRGELVIRAFIVALSLGALCAGGLLAGAGPRAARALTNCETATAVLSPAETQMLTLINEARALDGKGSLAPSAALNRAAAWKSEDGPKTGLSHTDLLGRSPFKRMPDCGYTNSGLAENVGAGIASTTAMFNAFMASPGHRAAILMAGAKAAGIGYAGGHWTIDFGTIVDSGVGGSAPPAPPPAPKPPQQLAVKKRAVLAMVAIE